MSDILKITQNGPNYANQNWTDEIKSEILQISGFSGRLEKILYMLIREQEDMKRTFEGDKDVLTSTVEKLKEDIGITQEELEEEKKQRKENLNELKDSIGKIELKSKENFQDLKENLDHKTEDLNQQLNKLDDKVGNDMKALNENIEK